MVVFEREGAGLVVHRAVTVGLRGEVRSKGDANETADRELVSPERLRGPVMLALPTGRLDASLTRCGVLHFSTNRRR
jgi:hypothetical protein